MVSVGRFHAVSSVLCAAIWIWGCGGDDFTAGSGGDAGSAGSPSDGGGSPGASSSTGGGGGGCATGERCAPTPPEHGGWLGPVAVALGGELPDCSGHAEPA